MNADLRFITRFSQSVKHTIIFQGNINGGYFFSISSKYLVYPKPIRPITGNNTHSPGIFKGNRQGLIGVAGFADAFAPCSNLGIAVFFQRHIAWLRQVLADGRANGTIGADVKPAQSARMVVATLEGALMMERLLGGPAGFKETLSALRKSLK